MNDSKPNEHSTGSRVLLGGRFGIAHAALPLGMWFGFAAVVVIGTAKDDRPITSEMSNAAVALLSVTGPMLGGIARGFQECCVEASLRLLPWCLGALAVAVAAQWFVRPSGFWRHATRLSVWTLAWSVWFGGAVLSGAHAFS